MTAPGSFLQSPEWEAFQRAVGRRTWRADRTLVIRHDLPMGCNYLYAPRPFISEDFFKESAVIGKKERSVFLKIDPLAPLSPIVHNLQPSISIQPCETVIIGLTKSEEELLAAMREKTRYNIRLAERRGVRIRNHESSITDEESFEIFWRLLQETAARDRFRTHPKGYYEKLLDARSDNFSNELFFAEYRGQAIAAAMINFYRGTATYLHGASAGEHRAVMAPHLLHWRIMQDGKRRGCVSYDLWGIDEKRWPGLTRFKKGFGGKEISYPQSIDVVYRPVRYRGYRLWRKFWKK